MAGFNKVLLMGNLTRDPQLSYTPNQTAVVDFGVATNRRWTGQDGTQHDETCFVDCRAFGRMAENINKYFKKGRPIFAEGRLTLDQWKAQDGSEKSKLRVIVENFQFLGGGQGQGAGSASADSGETGTESQVEPETNGPIKGAHPPADDIPF